VVDKRRLVEIYRLVYLPVMTSVRKGEATTARMVEAMLELIQSRGYAGTGINTVLERASAPKGSMYFHFPEGKEELAERAIGRAADQFRDLIGEAAQREQSPAHVVTGVLDVLARLLVDSNYELGCPVSVVTLEMGAHSERLRTACASAYESWVSSLENYLAASGLALEDARELAETVVSTVEGAMILSRAGRDIKPILSAGRVLGRLLDEMTEPQGAKR
jgi:TetR/AcrR family transcriptional repressor of lmrAB and yxaGH operons